MTRPRAAAFYFVLVHVGLAFDGDADGREALVVPFLNPFLKGRAAAAVDEHHARDLAFALCGQTDPGEDTRRLSLPGERVIEDGADRSFRLEALGFMDLRRLSAGVDETKHYLAIGDRVGEQCGGQENQAK